MLDSITKYLIGSVDAYVYALFLFNGLDFLSGLFSALKQKNFSTSKAMWGIGKKFLMLLIVVAGSVLDNLFGLNGILRKGVITILILTEGTSFATNLEECGVPMPSVLKNFLASAKATAEATDVSTDATK